MLVLTRKIGETLILDGGIAITVYEIQGKHVKVGIVAPKEVKVYREELLNRMKDENINDA